jgi:hypothetical protein
MVKSPPKAPPRAPAPPVRVEPSERPGFDSVAASVEKHMANRGFTQRAEHLADDIVRADQEMEQHLQKSFSRRIGTLGPTTPSPTGPVTDAEPVADQPQPAASAMMLGGVLASGQQLKQAFVLNEILQRPEHRW